MDLKSVSYPTIFILDDDYDIITSLTSMFESENFQVQAALDAKSFFKLLEKSKPDIFLIDVVLKADNGKRICGLVKSDSTLKNIPVILMSGIYNFHQSTAHHPVFADDYIDKPFSAQEILEKVSLLIKTEL